MKNWFEVFLLRRVVRTVNCANAKGMLRPSLLILTKTRPKIEKVVSTERRRVESSAVEDKLKFRF